MEGGEEMTMEEKERGFRCPDIVPPDATDDFCLSERCKAILPAMFRFPSPNTCLPEEVLEELELTIRNANQFLLDVALSGKREGNEIYNQVFKGLVGQVVEIELVCLEEEATSRVKGRVFLAGKNFSILRSDDKELLIPYEQIKLILPANRYAELFRERSLNDIDPCLRRCITYDFGSVVSNSPELIQIFFGLDLRIYLLQLLNQKIKIHVDGETMEGKLCDIDEETFSLKIDDDVKTMQLEKVCFVEVPS